ncbi:hypothetical protein K523DRAFT_241467 [Schizophyllum commune Tattone D]|nr:hypothetical protein K525DRAFT_212706 [Schizophyllum commune Loenen D]KAI5829749.1 hypothetical protein K523DRAFT_241467 [Schizophyllum commune Tattone D]
MASKERTPRTRSSASYALRALRPHAGALDTRMLTTENPAIVIARAKEVLAGMGLEIQVEHECKLRCIRPKKTAAFDDDAVDLSIDAESVPVQGAVEPLYGPPTHDALDEVRFALEITAFKNLEGQFLIEIRRLKGGLKSYKFLYETVREYVAPSCVFAFADDDCRRLMLQQP